MPSAYLLARDQIEQARAILANEIWFDIEVDRLFELAQARLAELDRSLDVPSEPHELLQFPAMPTSPRTRLMPWLKS